MSASKLFGRVLSRKSVPVISLDRPPLFTRVPPWWARWALALVACDIFMTASAIDLTWNRWTELTGDLGKIAEKNQKAIKDSPSTEEAYVPRPSWQRIGLCVGHLGVGIGVAVALLVTQSRYVRTFTISPALTRSKPSGKPLNQPKDRQVLLSSANNWKNNGKSFPIEKCSLSEGRDATEMILRVDGEKGHWYLALEDALIRGKKASVPDAQRDILAEWGAERKTGQWTPRPAADSRWVSGPVSRKPSRT
ncbi:hypothetical protein ONZ45_g13028 [Pleurotus djamor]|nr:hypothetical protein ONZ45_g13028 [Pleurotus djamor]